MADQEIIPAGASTPSPSAGSAAMPSLSNFTDFMARPAVSKAMPAVFLAGTLGLAALAWSTLSSPAQAPLYSGLADADKAAIADALSAASIPYQIDSSSGSITVAEGEVHNARIILAGQGLPKAAPSSDTMLASIPMGSSRAVEGESLRAAREADLARTIEAIDSVSKARVHLAVAEPSVFVRDQAAPAASVMLTLQPGRTLGEAQVRAIRHMVASSVPGMQPDQVSIVDQGGTLLSGQGSSVGDRNFELQQQIEDRTRQQIASLIGPIVGAGNFTVEVHADVDSTESQSTRETYPKDDRAVTSEQTNKSGETSSGANDAAAGIPGALSNQPPPASQLELTPATDTGQLPATTGTTGQSEESVSRKYDVGREISVTHKPQGALSRMSVAVALSDDGAKKRKPAELAAIEGLIKGAIGFDAQRGDVVAITSRPFAKQEAVATSFWDEPWFFPLLRQIGGVLVALLVLFFLGRPALKMVKQRKVQAAENAAVEQQLLSATDAGAAVSPRHVTLEMIEAAPSYEARANLVRTFVRQDPERAALVVRQLMQVPANG